METEHTPGPWIIEPVAGVMTIQSMQGDVVASAWEFCGRQIENAHLIAAAPDLLEACDWALLDLDPYGDETSFPKTIKALRDAVAKARGKTPETPAG